MTHNKNTSSLNRTHSKDTASLAETLQNVKHKIIARGDLPHASIEYQLKILDQLCRFPLGRFVLERKGANGFWTDYMIDHPNKGRKSGINIEGQPFTPLEDFFLNRCPVVVAHQERFAIFQQLIQKSLKDNMTLVSVPCGVMRDLLTLDFSNTKNCQLIGIDIDTESLSLAAQLAHNRGITNALFLQEDAWQMQLNQEVDLITSSGLNVYESDPLKILKLYKTFFKNLKPGGLLVISILTYPPGEEIVTDWDLSLISPEDLLMEQILHKDILDIKWRNFRSSKEVHNEFEKIGFSDISIHFDERRIFPTVLARKPL